MTVAEARDQARPGAAAAPSRKRALVTVDERDEDVFRDGAETVDFPKLTERENPVTSSNSSTVSIVSVGEEDDEAEASKRTQNRKASVATQAETSQRTKKLKLSPADQKWISISPSADFQRHQAQQPRVTKNKNDDDDRKNDDEPPQQRSTRRRATVPFLSKLVQLFEEEPDLIQWKNGSIAIPNPRKLEAKLPVYFRHSKYTSFQRQLNNFGYTKVDRSSMEYSVYVKTKGPSVKTIDDLLNLNHVRRLDDEPPRPGAALAKPTNLRAPSFDIVDTLLTLRNSGGGGISSSSSKKQDDVATKPEPASSREQQQRRQQRQQQKRELTSAEMMLQLMKKQQKTQSVNPPSPTSSGSSSPKAASTMFFPFATEKEFKQYASLPPHALVVGSRMIALPPPPLPPGPWAAPPPIIPIGRQLQCHRPAAF
mmetsp:Transcript_29508/g.90296  ORF Transcript_29508/g.90296 Transcript_29508/m.90296 type:complete len:425 (-) Transcript_29508:304-1578(-)|eukprot:CAMPEP_0198658996 /NCGR_PEP_ID=MMETSP1467-20131203/29324_1 /TAXON_ID=1462469 /ORGANISM="unid. sp., Strain CCMP2135" /LENGTH=424 /DNA_ID=CAMNT_0044395311 /DNA_START=85 /DNA_END=1359 /DNA_ORIENTATION=-